MTQRLVMILETFHFLRPWWFLALIPLLAIVLACHRRQESHGGWSSVCDPHLLPHLLIGSPRASLTKPLILISCGWILATIALAGPVWSKLPQPVFRNQSALILILDLSQSMNAQDIRPSRLERAKFKVLDILAARQEGLTGLVVFAGEPFIVSPLTEDTNTIAALVPPLSTQMMPVQGSHLEAALEEADRLFDQSGLSTGHILVLTDGPPGAPASSLLKMLSTLREQGRTVSILGVGTQEGAPIPLEGGGFLQDPSGTLIIPKREDSVLQAMTNAGGGTYVAMTADNQDTHTLLAHIDGGTRDQTVEETSRMTERWQEEGHWLLLAVLVFAAPAFRRGWLGTVLLLMILPGGAQAFTWEDWWWRPDQRGARLLTEKHPEQAAQTFEDPAWKGVAYYQAGNYAKAAEAFSQVNSADGQFNLGNALARSGQLQEALKAYQAALAQNPQHEDARFNAALIEELLKQQEQDSNQSGETGPEEQAESGSPSPSETQTPGNPRSADSAQTPSESKAPSTPPSATPPTPDSPPIQRADTTPSHEPSQDHSSSPEDLAGLDHTHPSPLSDSSDDQNAEESPQQPLASESTENEQQEATEPEEKRPPLLTAQQNPAERENRQQESRQALEQWLRRIPDDPGGLLRRKFYLEHLKRQRQQPSTLRGGQQEW